MRFRRAILDRRATRSAPSLCHLRKEAHIVGFWITSFAVNGYLVSYMYRIWWAWGRLRFSYIMVIKWVVISTSRPVSVKLSEIRRNRIRMSGRVTNIFTGGIWPQICKWHYAAFGSAPSLLRTARWGARTRFPDGL